MKKILGLILILVTIFPISVYAEEKEQTTNSYTKKHQTFIEFGTGLFSSAEQKQKIDNKKISSSLEHIEFNNSGYFSIGSEINGTQFYITPQYIKEEQEDFEQTEFAIGLNLDIAFFNSYYFIKPFLSTGISLHFINLENSEYDAEDAAFGFRVGFGIKMDINENVFAKIGAYYAQKEYEFEIEYVDVKIKQSGTLFKTSIGYRF